MKKFYFSTQKISQNVAKNQASTKKRERTQNIACGVRFTYVLYLIGSTVGAFDSWNAYSTDYILVN